MVLRALTAELLDAVVEVQREGAVAGLANVFPQDRYPFRVDLIRERWSHELADPGTDCFAVVSDGAVAGFAATRGAELLHFGTAVSTWAPDWPVRRTASCSATCASRVTPAPACGASTTTRGRCASTHGAVGWPPT